MNIELSIVICVFGYRKTIKKTLQSLACQELNKNLFEVIIVNNNKDKSYWNFLNSFVDLKKIVNLQLINEPRQGLSRARNLGIKKAKGSYIAYIDDDSYVKYDWIDKVLSYIKNIDGKTMCIGGPIMSYYLSVKPVWFKDEYANDLSKGTRTRYLKKGESFSGSNMVWKKDILIKYGGFNDDVGMKGDLLSVGEETDLFERIWKKTERKSIFLYYPDLTVYHLVPLEKQTAAYRLKRYYAVGISYFIRNYKYGFWGFVFNTIKVCGYFTISVILAILLIPFYKDYRNWIVERIGPLAFCFGFASKLIIIIYEKKQTD